MKIAVIVGLLLSLCSFTRAFVVQTIPSETQKRTASSPARLPLGAKFDRNCDEPRPQEHGKNLLAVAMVAVVLSMPRAVCAVSGGGLDYAGLDITGKDFSNQSYKGKDFTQVIAKGTNFAKSNLQGCRFYKAYLVNTNFEGADLRGASLEDTSMDGASLVNANAAGSYFSASLLDVASMENADFTDAQLPIKTQVLVCEREDVKGTNPTTGADTRESLMCP